MINMEWHKLLNPTTIKNDFYIRHKKTLGNSRFIRNIIATIVTITFLLFTVPTLIAESKTGKSEDSPEEVNTSTQVWNLIVALINIGLFSIPEAILMIIMVKTPVFHDAFLVRKEMKLFTWIVLIDLSIYLIVAILHYAFRLNGDGKTEFEFILDLFLLNCICFGMY
ncbi:hypothetical protein RFI_24091, partial [Reticulomyxa filosa]